MSRSAIPIALRREVQRRDADRCRYCGLLQVGQGATFMWTTSSHDLAGALHARQPGVAVPVLQPAQGVGQRFGARCRQASRFRGSKQPSGSTQRTLWGRKAEQTRTVIRSEVLTGQRTRRDPAPHERHEPKHKRLANRHDHPCHSTLKSQEVQRSVLHRRMAKPVVRCKRGL